MKRHARRRRANTGSVAGFHLATFPKCAGVSRRPIVVFNYKKKWWKYIDYTWSLLSDYPRRQRDERQRWKCPSRSSRKWTSMHGPIRPDRLRVRGSLPACLPACAGREQRGEGRRFLGLLNAKWAGTDPEARHSLEPRGAGIRKSPEIDGHMSECQVTTSGSAPLSDVASNMMTAAYYLTQATILRTEALLKKKRIHWLRLPSCFSLFSCFLPCPVIKMTLLWPHHDVPLPPTGRTVNGIL